MEQPFAWFKLLEAGLEIRLIKAELLGLLQRVGAQAHRAIFTENLPVGALVEILELEEFLGDDDVAFHADHLGNVGRAARTVAEALHLNDEVDRVGDLARNGFLRDLDVAHHHHVLHTSEAFAR